MNKLIIRNLTKSFNNQDTLIKNVNLVFEESKTYAIVGKSGLGKTTLLNMIANLDLEYEGEILFNGLNIKEIKNIDKRTYLNTAISYIHQNSILFENASVENNLRAPSLIGRNAPLKSLSLLNITNKKNRKIKDLSGGEKKRINIIQSLCKKSKIILADEPTANLDQNNAELVMQTLKRETKNKIFIFVTHNLEIASKYADEILEIQNKSINKNYKKLPSKFDKISFENLDTISNYKASKASKVFYKTTRSTSLLFVASTSVLLFCVGFCLSMAQGLKNTFIKNDEINENCLIQMQKNNEILNINDDDKRTIEETTDISLIKIFNKNNGGFKLNDNELDLNINLINYPFGSVSFLGENQIIIGLDLEFKTHVEKILQVNDIDDYIDDNSLYLTYSDGNIDLSFEVLDFIIQDKTEIYANNPSAYLLFHDNQENYNMGFKQNDLNQKAKSFFLSSNKYLAIQKDSYYEVYKYRDDVILYSTLKNNNFIALPIIENNTNYWVHFSNGLLYFNNANFIHNGEIVSEQIFFSPFKSDLLLGRQYENENELIISSKLYNLIGKESLGNYLEIEFNNKTVQYKIVGVYDSEINCIFQNSDFVYEKFFEKYNIEQFSVKANEFLIISSINDLNTTIENLKTKFNDYYISSDTSEILNVITNTSKTISNISFGISIFISIISLLSLILLCKIEKNNNEKQVFLLKCFGLIEKDLNKIYFKILNKRMIKNILIVFSILYIFIKISNSILKDSIIGAEVLSNSIYIYLIMLIYIVIIYFLTYNFTKFGNKKGTN